MVFCVHVYYLGLWFILIWVLCKNKYCLWYRFHFKFLKTQHFCWPLALCSSKSLFKNVSRTLFTWRALVCRPASGFHREGLADRAASNLLPAHRKKKELAQGGEDLNSLHLISSQEILSDTQPPEAKVFLWLQDTQWPWPVCGSQWWPRSSLWV